MSSAPILTRFRLEHLSAIVALHRSAMKGFIDRIDQHQDEADLRDIDRCYVRAGGDFLVGVLDGKVVAMGGLKRLSKTKAELKRMRIDAQYQGRGYGTQLLVALEQRAFELGFHTLCLQTASTRTLAMKFYEKHGYKKVGRGRYGDVETTQFAKQIDTASIGGSISAADDLGKAKTTPTSTGMKP